MHSGEDVAIKLEEKKCRFPQLHHENMVLSNIQTGIGIPTIYWNGQDGDYNVIVMQLLDENLAWHLKACKGQFSLKTCLMIADQLICLLQLLHSKGFVHRDIKPENFCLGTEESAHLIYMIDFGLSKQVLDPSTDTHVPFRDNKSPLGQMMYASINNMQGNEISRRDDLESVFYMLLSFYLDELPWSELIAQADHLQQQR